MAKSIEQLEQKFNRLRDQHVSAAAALAKAAKANGSPIEGYFIMPATESVLGAISDIEKIGGVVPDELIAFREMADERRKKIDLLPPDVRVAISRFTEIEGLLANVQSALIRKLLFSGVGVAEIAERLDLSEEFVRSAVETSEE